MNVRKVLSVTRGSGTLEIVWRNPGPTPFDEHHIKRLENDDYGAVYAVCRADRTTVFELIRRRVGEAATGSVVDDSTLTTRVRIEELWRKIQ